MSFGEILHEELAAVPRRIGGRPGILMWIFAIAVMGVLLPWVLGYGFLDMPLLLAYTGMSLLFAGPLVAESFAGERERNAVPSDPRLRRDLLLARITVGVLYGWVSPLAMMALGFAIVNLHYRPQTFLLPPAAVSLDLALLTLLAALLVSSLAAAVAVRARDARRAKRTLRQGFLLSLVALIWFVQSGGWKIAAASFETQAGMMRLAGWAALIILPLSGGLLRLALAGWDRPEIAPDI
jgi:hypothetical protein